jgi:hypothetical protein
LVFVKVINAVGIEQRTTTLHTVHLVSFAQQQLSEVCTILPGYSGYKGSFLHVLKFNFQI